MRQVMKAATAGVLIAAAGITVTGCGTGGPAASTGAAATGATGSSATSAPAAASSTPAAGAAGDVAPTGGAGPEQSKAQLLAKVPGQQALVVSVPSGFEAVSYDQRGHVGFWTDSPAGWHEDTAGSYPYFAGAHAEPDVKATGALLSGMRHATFVLTGSFSEDGTGNAIGYTDGSSGWGVVVAQPNGNLAPASPKVDSRNSGVSYGLTLTRGRLQTEDCSSNQPLAQCGSSTDDVKKLWRWDGRQFVRTG